MDLIGLKSSGKQSPKAEKNEGHKLRFYFDYELMQGVNWKATRRQLPETKDLLFASMTGRIVSAIKTLRLGQKPAGAGKIKPRFTRGS